jgi:hypothetical protein
VKIHEKYNCCQPHRRASIGLRIGDAQPRSGHCYDHLHGRNDNYLHRQGHLQRPWRRAKGGAGGASRTRSCTCGEDTRGARSRRDDHLLGWHDDHVDRQGHLQRPWRNTESHEV